MVEDDPTSESEPERPTDEGGLRDLARNMEARVRKIRDARDAHNLSARDAADRRNTVQEQRRGLSERWDERLELVKEHRDRSKAHQMRRDAIQQQLRELIAQSKGQRADRGGKKSAALEFSRLASEQAQLEVRYETSGRVSPEKEKEIMNRLKEITRRRKELAPEVEAMKVIDVDLTDLEASIKTLKSEADHEHELHLAARAEANIVSKELDEIKAERDHLRAEGDRFHALYIEEREAANAVHERMKAVLDELNAVRDSLKAVAEERKSWRVDHNAAVRAEMRTASESDEVADALLNRLQTEGSIQFGGLMSDDATSGRAAKPKSKRRKRIGAAPRKAGVRKVDR